MVKRIYIFILFILPISVYAQVGNQDKPLYKSSQAPVEARVQDLLGRMNLEEKLGQLNVLLGWGMYDKQGDSVAISEAFRKAMDEQHIGMFWATFRADPWTKKTLLNGLNPKLAAEVANAIQHYAMEHTRLGIPVVLAEECMHGHMAIGTTVFPTAIGQASTWDPQLIHSMAEVIARETRLQGAHIGYGPILDMAREPRWSRVEETFGEDTYLITEMGKAVVTGFQGKSLSSGSNVAATLKHFAAYGISEAGQNGGSVTIGERELVQYYLPPFKAAVQAGVASVMTSYNSLDGIPCSSNPYLLTDVLRKKWGFNGFVVSDLGSIEGIYYTHSAAATPAEAAALSIKAGMDVDLGGNGFGKALAEAVKNGSVTSSQIDTAVARVLRLKFNMGLFDNPYVNPATAATEVHSEVNTTMARLVARESIILLKNEKNLLPISKNVKNIAVIGPNADNMYNQLGDYTAPQDENSVVTVLEGIRAKVGKNCRVVYAKGCAIRDTSRNNIPEAVMAAKSADVAIVVLGGSSARDFKTEYESTGAANAGKVKGQKEISDMESGEGYDRTSLDLMGNQLRLVKEIVKTGTPVIVVLIKGRPLNLNWISENVPAVLDAWYPGMQGGNAIADVLFGDYNPAGRLPVSVPRSVGQLPVYYSHKAPAKHSYVEEDGSPLYPFGYGLSYSKFEYANLKTKVVESGDSLAVLVQFDVKNTGSFNGDEVAQVYLHDKVSSVVLPLIQLKRFQRIPLKVNESKTLSFVLGKEDLKLFDINRNWTVEPGVFELSVGASSSDIRLKGEFNVQNKYSVQ